MPSADGDAQQQHPQKEPDAWEKSVYSIEVGDLLFQGAESRVHKCVFYGKPAVYKHRFVKRYRNEALDERLRSQRTRHEARALQRCLKKGIRAPRLLGADYINTFIVMTYEEGPTLKEALDQEHAQVIADAKLAASSETTPSPMTAALLRSMGVVVAMLHNANIVHGDLTTSNFISTFEEQKQQQAQPAITPMLGEVASSSETAGKHKVKVSPGPPFANTTSTSLSSSPAASALPTAQDIVVLDFGLISDKYSAEERAVDLYVLERAITSTHPYLSAYASDTILEGYRSAADPRKGAETLKRLEAVRARGRKRSMVG